MSFMGGISPSLAKVAFVCATAVELAACGTIPNARSVVRSSVDRSIRPLERDAARAGYEATTGILNGGVSCIATLGQDCAPRSNVDLQQQIINERIRQRDEMRRRQGGQYSPLVESDNDGVVDLGFTPEP